MWTHFCLVLLSWFSCCLCGFYNWNDIVEIITSTRASCLFFLPKSLILAFSDKWYEAVHSLPAMQTLILPHIPRQSHSHHPQGPGLSSFVCIIKRRDRSSTHINGMECKYKCIKWHRIFFSKLEGANRDFVSPTMLLLFSLALWQSLTG